jgi:hypothetical protein
MVYTGAMKVTKRTRSRSVRRSIALPAKLARKINSLAKRRRLSDNRVLLELIEQGIDAQKQKEKTFFELASRFRAASEPEEVKTLGDELGRLVFGE